jgi:hypothetical protein
MSKRFLPAGSRESDSREIFWELQVRGNTWRTSDGMSLRYRSVYAYGLWDTTAQITIGQSATATNPASLANANGVSLVLTSPHHPVQLENEFKTFWRRSADLVTEKIFEHPLASFQPSNLQQTTKMQNAQGTQREQQTAAILIIIIVVVVVLALKLRRRGGSSIEFSIASTLLQTI